MFADSPKAAVEQSAAALQSAKNELERDEVPDSQPAGSRSERSLKYR